MQNSKISKILTYSSRNFNLKSYEKNLAIRAFKLIRNEKINQKI